MKTAYLDCASGVSGDMFLAAMVDVGVDLGAIQAGVDSLGLPGCRLVAEEIDKRGFRAMQIVVKHEPEHAHRHLADIEALIDGGALTVSQADLARRVFRRLAEAEAKVHGTTVDRIHFHEVGAVDSIADIVGAAIGWDLLGVECLVSSPIPTGCGFIEIAHGRVSVPAPATAELLRGVPIRESHVEGELTTPTGAAIVTTLAKSFGPLPAMAVDRIGYGAGQADFKHPNVLRLLVGSAATAADSSGFASAQRAVAAETICVLETNIDDVPGEFVGHCIEQLWQGGALDVATTPIQMKKGRPGIALAVQCRPDDADSLEAVLFSETTTLGVRRSFVERRVLARETGSVGTRWGAVEGTVVTLPDGKRRFAPAYEACRRIAGKHKVALPEVFAAAHRAWEAEAEEGRIRESE